MHSFFLNQGFRNLWSNERLLNLIEQLIGPDIMGNPVWNVRPKVPGNEALVIPWHQGKINLSISWDSEAKMVLEWVHQSC